MNTSRLILTNVIWKYLEQLSLMGIQLICTAVMARFLTPEDYGIYGIVLVFSTFAEVFVNSGFANTLIRENVVSRTDYSTVLYFNVTISVVIYVLLFISSNVIANFYNQIILKDICKVVFLILPLSALSIVQMTKLQREIRFKKIFCISFASSLISAIVAISVAYFYRSVWALVIQIVTTFTVRCILLWITTDFIPELKFSVATFKRYFNFSKNLLISSLIGTFFDNIYTLIIGKTYSAVDLGLYTQAKKISDICSNNTTRVVQSVTYPILSNINNSGNELKAGYKKIISSTLIIVGVVMAFLMSCAHDLFELFMGSPTWRVAGTYFLLLGINGILYPLHCINQNILLVKGDSKTILRLEMIRRCIMIIILVTTINFNIEVFIGGISLYSIILIFLNLYYCGKPIKYTVKEQLKDTMPIFFRIAIMVLLAQLAVISIPIIYPLVRMVLSVFVCLTSGLLLFRKQKDFEILYMLLKSYMKK